MLEAYLADKPYILGDKRSVADAYAFPMIRWAMAKLPEQPGDYLHVRALHDRLAEDTAVKKVLDAEAQA